MTKLRNAFEALHSGLWFIPTLIVFASIALAFALIETETLIAHRELIQRWPRVFGVAAEGARGMLASIAGSMITVAGVTFSITSLRCRWRRASTRRASCATSRATAPTRRCSEFSSACSLTA